jgi:hypothetical protein
MIWIAKVACGDGVHEMKLEAKSIYHAVKGIARRYPFGTIRSLETQGYRPFWRSLFSRTSAEGAME